MPKRDDDTARVRFDGELAASAKGSPTVGGDALGQAVRLGLESIQRHVVACVVAAMAKFCVGWARGVVMVVSVVVTVVVVVTHKLGRRSSGATQREAGPRGRLVHCWQNTIPNDFSLPARSLRHISILSIACN